MCTHYAGCVGKAIVVFGPSSRDRELVDNLCRDDADTHDVCTGESPSKCKRMCVCLPTMSSQ